MNDGEQVQPRRTRVEIVLDILKQLGKESIKPTHIMYKCGITWTTTRKYLDMLLEKGYVSEEDYYTKGRRKTKRKLYCLTKRGFSALQRLQEALDFVDEVNS